MSLGLKHAGVVLGLVLMGWLGEAAQAESPNLAPGFEGLPKDAPIALVPPEVELFSLSAGGGLESRMDWTEAARGLVETALREKALGLGIRLQPVAGLPPNELSELNALHAAVGRAVALHHLGPRDKALPSKGGKLDWSLGEAVQPVRAKSGADYGVFLWLRDSYATSERKAAMVATGLLVGMPISGGEQTGYVSLVDLRSGRILWFNRIQRSSGDLREPVPAAETLDILLTDFPSGR